MDAVLVDLKYAFACVVAHRSVSCQCPRLVDVVVAVVLVLCVVIAMAVEVQSRLLAVQVLETDSPSR